MSKPRKILFRGKATVGDKNHKKGEFVYGNLIYKCGVPAIYTDREDSLTDIVLFIDPATVGQFTGLTDKNGKEIFEGDVVRWTINDVTPTAPVEYKEGAFWMAEDITTGYYTANDWLRGEYEVVGNIHDNPELIKTKQA